MRATEFITELFDRDVPGRVVRQTADLFTTRATIGDRDIIFNATFFIGKNKDLVSEVDFVEKVPGDTRFNKTKSGNEYAVFSFILQSLKKLIANYRPELISFSSSRDDQNRSKLYWHMIKKYGSRLGYEIMDVTDDGHTDYFTLRRTDA